jgi:alpha-pyrone synthase
LILAKLINISFVPAAFEADMDSSEAFYLNQLDEGRGDTAARTLRFLNRKSGIFKRHFALPDIKQNERWLYKNGAIPGIEERMKLFSKLAPELASKAIEKLLSNTQIEATQITHLITVSCTGQTTPGLEWQLATKWNLVHAEKFPLNFLGCHAGLKALSLARQLCQQQPNALVLIVAVELSSLHFYPSAIGEDMVSNILFADGAAAALVGGESVKVTHPTQRNITKTGHAFVPDSAEKMTWNLSASAFRMHLSPQLVDLIGKHVAREASDFLGDFSSDLQWAVHPGGIRILEAVEEACTLVNNELQTSKHVLEQFGNMSSVTILAILEIMLLEPGTNEIPLLAIAFGPGVSMEFCLLEPALS